MIDGQNLEYNLTNSFLSQWEQLGIKPNNLYRNLSVDELIQIAVNKEEGIQASNQALAVKTGKFTGRSPNDRYIVDDANTHNKVDWGKINHPISEEAFDKIFDKMKQHLNGKDLFVFDGFVGADPDYRLPLRVVNDHAWQSLFSRQLFIRPTKPELESHKPEFTVYAINDFEADPADDGTNSNVFIIINPTKKVVLIGATPYAGEIKKSMFSVMNYILPERGIFPMHCSSNIGRKGDTALFFGLSGTGKTSLSADPNRLLIGDDEHGWSDKGVFNFEGGCYAKCIRLDKDAEPQIWNAIKKGTILENVVVDKNTLEPDYDDDSLTENTRAAYPLDYIPGSIIPSIGDHPKVIIFLTADAMGVMPPISKLDKEGAIYHFMSGYTSKLAGTERGIKKPLAEFSACFGAPFMPLHPIEYAKLLGEKITQHKTSVYLINTGWSGGPYGIGDRIDIQYSRAMVQAALDGKLEDVSFRYDDIFNLNIPTDCPDVPSEILNPRNTWAEEESYNVSAKKLAGMFVENFKKFGSVPKEIVDAGPQINSSD